MNTKKLGLLGEEMAAKYLAQNGCRIIEKNFRVRSGEIDLIVLDKDCLCFVEVKTRTAYGSPQEAVSINKQKKITRLAKFYLRDRFRHLDVRCRFDVVAVDEQSERILWFKSAFESIE